VRLLLHCCCGPCTTPVVEHFRGGGAQVEGWFHNPNLYPAAERVRRQEGLATAAAATDLPQRAPGPETRARDVLLALARAGGRRCDACYRLRLEAAAEEAVAAGCEGFATTLVISPYQDLAALQRIGEEAGARHGVSFAFVDLRAKFAESRTRARELGLYQQNYCGCLFSLLERAVRRSERAIAKALARGAWRIPSPLESRGEHPGGAG
jgi:predicted adenine nucleotide alpha hydrolase (AANH) superfamily ATPase